MVLNSLSVLSGWSRRKRPSRKGGKLDSQLFQNSADVSGKKNKQGCHLGYIKMLGFLFAWFSLYLKTNSDLRDLWDQQGNVFSPGLSNHCEYMCFITYYDSFMITLILLQGAPGKPGEPGSKGERVGWSVILIVSLRMPHPCMCSKPGWMGP